MHGRCFFALLSSACGVWHQSHLHALSRMLLLRVQVVKRVTARYKGVNWNSGNQKWKAQIKVDGKVTHLGYFENEDVAARKYDEMAAAQGKPVNFPAPHSGQQQASKGGAEGGSRGGSSIYKGVCWDKVNSHWKATIKVRAQV